MYSVRLAPRQTFTGEKCPTLEQMRLVNQLAQISLLPSSHRNSRQRDRRYAREVVNQSVLEWLRNSQKSKKQKRHSHKQSVSPSKKRHSINRQTHSNLTSPMSSAPRSTNSSRTLRRKSEIYHELYAPSFPTRITTEHVTLRKNSFQKDYGSLVNIRKTPSMSSVVDNSQYSCEITMTYQSDVILSIDLHNAKRDEVTILQETNNDCTFVVFKGFLRPGDTFAFKSQRSTNDRFHLIICINDLVDSHLSSCCEFQYQYGFRIGGENGLFWIQGIDGAKQCRKCREDTDVPFKPHSVNDKMSVSSSSKASSRLKFPVINTNRSTSAMKSKSTSVAKSTAGDDASESRVIIARDTMVDGNKFRRISTTSQSTVSLPKDVRPSSILPSTNFKSSAQKSNSKQSSSESIISNDSKNVAVPTRVSSSSDTVPEKTIVNGSIPTTELTASLSLIATSNNDTTLTQSLMTLIQQSMSRFDSQRPIPPRITGDVENFILAWIGPSEESDIIVLRHVVNFVRVFYNADALNTFLTECIHSKVIILLSYDKAQSILNQMYKLPCVYSIYVLSTNEYEQTDWTKGYHRITGVYQTVRSLRDHLLQTLPQVSSALIPIIITSESTTNDIPFTYCQLLKETMLCIDDESDLKKDMLEFCRFHYESNPIEMNNIDKFEEEFTPEKVIWWYTRNFFIAKVLNRAVRTQEIDLLYKMRYIMQCLHTQLKSIAMHQRTTVYTVLDIPLQNAMKLQENINGLLIFGSYLPAMLEQPQTVNLNEDEEQISITFSINLAPGCGARVKNLCSSDSNIDVLINIDAAFRIHSVKKDNDRHWNVTLDSISHTDYQFKQLMEPLRREIEAPAVLLQTSKLLLATDHYSECDYLAELVFSDESLRGDPTLLASLAAVHHLLGNADDERGHFKAACVQYLKSLRAFQSFLPPDHPLMSASYNNIGSMFFKDNEFNEAITFHQKALDCQLKSGSPDPDAIATYSNNIGAVYYEQGKYFEALKHLQRAATILEILSPSDKSLHLCLIYQKIAAIYWRMNKANEALEYYKKTLDIQLVSLPPTAHQISVTYFNLSTAYARVGQIDDAVISAEKSIEQLLKIFPPDHPEVKENQAQLEIVRQKQWLQQVLTT